MIVSDSGWKGQNLGRCYNRYTRVVVFDKNSMEQEIVDFENSVRKEMYGQSSSIDTSVKLSGDVQVIFMHTVDSSD